MALSAFRANPAEKEDLWIQVHTPHFVVVSNGTEKQARRTAEQFEQIRAVLQRALPRARVDPGAPITILAAKNEPTLKTLLPEFWEHKGSMHPAGLFVTDQDKNYVALRQDVTGENPYQVIYHEYVHMLIRLNYGNVPVWLNEGLAEFYGNTTIGERDVYLGRYDESYLMRLHRGNLLPLETLFTVDRNSPHYNEASKTSVFYAESWALVHYLAFSDEGRKQNLMVRLLEQLQSSDNELEATERALGDPVKLQQKLQDYINQVGLLALRMNPPAQVSEKEFVVRPLPAAESLAIRGDFHLRLSRFREARVLLGAALRRDPELAMAHTSLGYLSLRLGDRERAAASFARAVELDPRDSLAQYYHARMISEGVALTPLIVSEAEAGFLRAIELNPNFAPAYAALGSLYSLDKETLAKALVASSKSVTLDPVEPAYRLNLGRVLMRMEKFAEAQALGRRILAGARSPDARSEAESYLREVTQYERGIAERKRAEEEARTYAQQAQSETRTRIEPPANPQSELPGPSSPLVATGPTRSARGTIREVDCSAGSVLVLTLVTGEHTLRLHATNFYHLEYQSLTWQPPTHFNPCIDLKGLPAEITFRLLKDQPYDAEIVAITVRK
jgi:tetratricopeptide (TPR) repeat protein